VCGDVVAVRQPDVGLTGEEAQGLAIRDLANSREVLDGVIAAASEPTTD
jgi:hypothetical protein